MFHSCISAHDLPVVLLGKCPAALLLHGNIVLFYLSLRRNPVQAVNPFLFVFHLFPYSPTSAFIRMSSIEDKTGSLPFAGKCRVTSIPSIVIVSICSAWSVIASVASLIKIPLFILVWLWEHPFDYYLILSSPFLLLLFSVLLLKA